MPWQEGEYVRCRPWEADDILRPAGHRLLMQMPHARTEADARAELVRTFGKAKGNAAVLVAGSRGPKRPGGAWEWSQGGFRAYLPVGWKESKEGVGA